MQEVRDAIATCLSARWGRLVCIALAGVQIASLLLAAPGMAAGHPSPEAARAALAGWFAEGAKVRTVQADFEQLRKLRSVRNPLRKQGRLWMDKSGSQFRWQIGEPPELLAVRGRDGDMTVLDTRKKEARVWSREALESEEQRGRGQGFAMLHSMQGMSVTQFDERFELDDWTQDGTNASQWTFDWRFKDAKISLVVLKLSLQVNVADGSLQSFTVHMRDGSSMSTVIRSQVLNQPISAEVFKVDTTGCAVEHMPARS